jgi:hypothetical protein
MNLTDSQIQSLRKILCDREQSIEDTLQVYNRYAKKPDAYCKSRKNALNKQLVEVKSFLFIFDQWLGRG